MACVDLKQGKRQRSMLERFRRLLACYGRLKAAAAASCTKKWFLFQYGATGASSADSSGTELNLEPDLPSSMELLRAQLASGEAEREFERLCRTKSGLRMQSAYQAENRAKNRYMNVLPYDSTRVVLQEAPGGSSYINASRIILYPPGSELARHYIATQGPLESTVADLWQCLFENMCCTVVMLTDLVEAGRPKCHRYWPPLNECHEHNKLLVSCVREENPSEAYFARKPYILREFCVLHLDTQQELQVLQFQFTDWPDHGVPKRQAQFLDFLLEVRERAPHQPGPTVVHCSAGVGRSGVFIMLDYALTLIEGLQPVRPLEIVRSMRDSRPGMIQVGEQYRFACECILALYERYTRGALSRRNRNYD